MRQAFHGQHGIGRVVEGFVSANFEDQKIGEIFAGQDHVRLRRT